MHSHLALRLALLPRAERGLLLAHALGDKELFFLREGSAVDPPRGGLGSRRCGRRRRRSWRCRCRLFGDDDSIGRGRERRSSVGDCFSGACCCSLFFGHVVLDGWDGFSRGGFFDGASWRRAGGVQHWSPLFLSFFFQIRISKHFRPKGSESSRSTLDGKKKTMSTPTMTTPSNRTSDGASTASPSAAPPSTSFPYFRTPADFSAYVRSLSGKQLAAAGAAAVATPLLVISAWWLAEKSFNTMTPYQVRGGGPDLFKGTQRVLKPVLLYRGGRRKGSALVSAPRGERSI